jgi:hypothetical protein
MAAKHVGDAWYTLALWRKVIYLIGAIVIGLALAGIPTAPLFVLASALGLTEQLRAALTGGLGVVAWAVGVFLVYQAMRQNYEYVHSVEYVSRNSE